MPEYLTATQAAKELGTSLTNVARWCREKVGTFASAERLQVGNSRIWQIPAEAVEAFTPPARGPKPAQDRKRLLEMAKEVVEEIGSETLSCDEWIFFTSSRELAQQAHCSRARARQALAKAIRMAREDEIFTHLPKPTSQRTIEELSNPDDRDGPQP